MAKPRRDPAAARLEGLLEAGDLRAARAEAARIVAGTVAPPDDPTQALARAALERGRPERGAAVAAALGFALFTAAALLGLLSHR